MEQFRMDTKNQPPSIEKPPNPKKEKLSQILQKEFTGTVLKWINSLDLKLSKFKPNMPHSRRLGSIFAPAVFLTTLIGCGELKKIDCSKDEAALLDSSLEWADQHPQTFEDQMKQYWPHPSISGRRIVKTLKESEIYCAEKRGEPSSTAGTVNLMTEEILIDVKSDDFKKLLPLYTNNQWVEGATLNDIFEIIESGEDPNEIREEVSDFYRAVFFVYSIMIHESVHFTLGDHSDKVKARIEILREDLETDSEARKELETIDEIYAWGTIAEDMSYEEVFPTLIDPIL